MQNLIFTGWIISGHTFGERQRSLYFLVIVVRLLEFFCGLDQSCLTLDRIFGFLRVVFAECSKGVGLIERFSHLTDRIVNNVGRFLLDGRLDYLSEKTI